jgi:hypothetical protein
MENSFTGPNADNDITDELDALFNMLPQYLEAYDKAMTDAQAKMEAMGYKGMSGASSNANATTGSFQQISETTGSVIAGGVTSIRLMMEQIKLSEVESSIREQGIARNLEDIRGLSLIAMGHLESIANYTSVLPSMKNTVELIEKRTRER